MTRSVVQAPIKKIKEFVYKEVFFRISCSDTLFLNLRTLQVLYGWNMQKIVGAIRSTIESSSNVGSLHIDYKLYSPKV